LKKILQTKSNFKFKGQNFHPRYEPRDEQLADEQQQPHIRVAGSQQQRWQLQEQGGVFSAQSMPELPATSSASALMDRNRRDKTFHSLSLKEKQSVV
jgi:hypothetical protein